MTRPILNVVNKTEKQAAPIYMYTEIRKCNVLRT